MMRNVYQDWFEREFPLKTDPSWLKKYRQEGMGRFTSLGIPTTDWEDWRFTNLQALAGTCFQPIREYHSAGFTLENLKNLPLCPMEGCHLVFINGHFSPDLSSLDNLPPGVRVESLGVILEKEPHLAESYFGQNSEDTTHPFFALNSALFGDGAFLFVPPGVILKTPIYLQFVSKPNGAATASFPRNLIVAERQSQVAVVESYVGVGPQPYFSSPVTQIYVGEGAVVDHCKIQGENEAATHLASIDVFQGPQSQYLSHSISIGGNLARNDLRTLLKAEGAQCTLNGLYLGAGKQLVDNHTVIDHLKPHGSSQEFYKGILDGQSHGVFHGKIMVRPGAEKSRARQTNKNLLLSDDAVIDTTPLLEIFNNDVKCNHGATIGRLDDNQVFYLRSRGVSLDHARHLLTYAFASDVVSSMKIESLKVRLQEIISLHLMRRRKGQEGL